MSSIWDSIHDRYNNENLLEPLKFSLSTKTLWITLYLGTTYCILALSRHYLLYLLFAKALKPKLHCLFILAFLLLVSSASVDSNPSSRITQSLHNALRGGGHLFGNIRVPWDFGILRNPKTRSFSVNTRKCIQTMKFCKTLCIRLQKSLHLVYAPNRSAHKSLSHIASALL